MRGGDQQKEEDEQPAQPTAGGAWALLSGSKKIIKK